MRLHVAIDNRFLLHDGDLYDTYTQDEGFWDDYLKVFDEVVVVGRAKPVDDVPADAHRSTGPEVTFQALSYWEGPVDYLWTFPKLRRELDRIADEAEAAILRVPGLVGQTFASRLADAGVPFAVEVVQDTKGAYPRLGPLSWLVEAYLERGLSRTCREASAASYVTERALQERFPASNARAQAHYSSARLSEERLVDSPKRFDESPRPFVVCHVGGMYDGRKGQDLLLEALRELRDRGLPVRGLFAGDGSERSSYETKAASLDLTDDVTFLGNVPHDAVFEDVLDPAHLFVLPSKSEGLPRALLEAMARGTPALATPVSGIPEVLPDEALIPREPQAIAETIEHLASNPDVLAEMSERNLARVEDFTEGVLRRRRLDYYCAYRRIAEGST